MLMQQPPCREAHLPSASASASSSTSALPSDGGCIATMTRSDDYGQQLPILVHLKPITSLPHHLSLGLVFLNTEQWTVPAKAQGSALDQRFIAMRHRIAMVSDFFYPNCGAQLSSMDPPHGAIPAVQTWSSVHPLVYCALVWCSRALVDFHPEAAAGLAALSNRRCGEPHVPAEPMPDQAGPQGRLRAWKQHSTLPSTDKFLQHQGKLPTLWSNFQLGGRGDTREIMAGFCPLKEALTTDMLRLLTLHPGGGCHACIRRLLRRALHVQRPQGASAPQPGTGITACTCLGS